MSKNNTLTAWLKPASSTTLNSPKAPALQAPKRKRTSTTLPVEATEEDEDEEEEEPSKKQKTAKKAPVKKTPAKKASANKAAGGSDKATEQLYKKLIEEIDKKAAGLDARVKKMSPNSTSVTSDNYASAMIKFVKDIRKLMVMGQDGAKAAFNALLHMGPRTHGDLDATAKMCGYGEHEGPYAELDDLMLEIIALREDTDCAGLAQEDGKLPKVKHRWSHTDADVGVFKTGRPNKQQRGQIERQRAAWMKERFAAARERREKVGDWVGNALDELMGEQLAIEDYGLEGYFTKSIAVLSGMQHRGGGIVVEKEEEKLVVSDSE